MLKEKYQTLEFSTLFLIGESNKNVSELLYKMGGETINIIIALEKNIYTIAVSVLALDILIGIFSGTKR